MQRCCEQVIEAAYRRSPELVEPVLPTAHAYMYRYLARLSLTTGDAAIARDFIDRAIAADRSIFYRDVRSLLTLVAVRMAPLAKLVIGRALGSVEYTRK